MCTPPLVLQAEKRAVYPPLGVTSREKSLVPPPWAKMEGERRIRPPHLWPEAKNWPFGKLTKKYRAELVPSCVLPPWPNRELICMSPPLGSNQRVEVGPAPSRVPPSWSPSRESKLCTPPLAKRRADLHVPPPWFQSESRNCSGSTPCTPLLVSK